MRGLLYRSVAGRPPMSLWLTLLCLAFFPASTFAQQGADPSRIDYETMVGDLSCH